MGRPESQSKQAAGEVFRRFCLRRELGDALKIDEDLVEVAAQASKPLAAGPSRRELSAWIRGLPEKDKNELLITAAVEQDERWRNDLVRRFRRTNLQ